MEIVWTDHGSVALIADGNTSWIDDGAIFQEATSGIKKSSVVFFN